MKDQKRIDTQELGKPRKDANGWLRVDGFITRTGVFVYGMPDGTTRREYRPPDEVFKSDSLSSFELVPVTDEHPPVFLTAENAVKYQRGAVSSPKVDGGRVRATMLITDAGLVAKLEGGEARQVSCGYVCDLEDAQGVTPDGQRYDAIQRNIRGNHVAIVPVGRAGPEVRVRMDAAEALNEAPATKEHHHMKTIKLDGITVEVSDQAAEIIEKLEARHADAVKAAQAKADAAQAKADAAGEELAKVKAELKELPVRLRADMAARAELEAKARAVLGEKAKLDGLDALGVRKAVLAKLAPSLNLDGKSEAYVEARFDAALEAHREDGEEDSTTLKQAAKLDAEPSEDGRQVVDADEAQKKYQQACRDAWKTPLASAKVMQGAA